MSAENSERPGKSVDELRRIYGDAASQFDRAEPFDRLFLGRSRHRLFSRASGRVLDVACGTGANFPYLPAGVSVVGVDLSPEMLERARKRADELGIDADLREADAQALPFGDDSFDTVVSSLSTCTFPDPVAALEEMARVCEPDGQILLLEHGRSRVEPLARLQDRFAPWHFEQMGCRWNQTPEQVVIEAGLRVDGVSHRYLGILTELVASPSEQPSDSHPSSEREAF
ncbi:class I SAM-dependent methyltransferase [Haloprofundus halophilus]|uniref:class I SAM-dependent methyltransferase n=1 Tax=Haloprofundus halophilus TaxID=2283527 RepID=UPI000E43ED0D|nr:class I SAM-dependent methyltransferase [Haloprofundus halophilus]